MTVSAVIPTIGRATLVRAVESVLGQTRPVTEIIVVADHDGPVFLPPDHRITLLRSGFQSGPARSRQLGIDAARGSIVALLDDDDEWYPDKLERQLEAAKQAGCPHWVASSKVAVLGPGSRRRTWPRRLIAPRQSVTEYLYRVDEIGVGGALLQTSTLCFPTELAQRIRWDAHADSIHDEPSWLIEVQRSVPDLSWIQLPDVLGVYHVGAPSVSRSNTDLTDDYIRWGLRYLRAESPRILGDYLCSSPVSAAVSARSAVGVHRAIRASRRYGRPGLPALTYAVLNALRIMALRVGAVIR